jgi:biotin carboxyl carrier protein
MNDFVISVNSAMFDVQIIDENELIFNSEKISYELIQVGVNSYLLKLDKKIFQLTAEKTDSDSFKVLVEGNYFDIKVRTALQEKAYRLLESSSTYKKHHSDIKAPMPGLILKIKRNVGDKVEQGESVIILEAMKMENDLKSPSSGIIEKVFVSDGSVVEKGATLFSLA